MTKRILLSILMGAGMFASLTPAFAAGSPNAVLACGDVDSFAAVARGLGYGADITPSGSSRPVVLIQTSDGYKFLAAPVFGTSGKCFGLLMDASFGNDNGTQAKLLNDFNARGGFEAVAFGSEGKIGLARAQQSDYGVIAGNLSLELKQFAYTMRIFNAALSTGRVAAAAPSAAMTKKALGETLSNDSDRADAIAAALAAALKELGADKSVENKIQP
jgi:hypothetical protein